MIDRFWLAAVCMSVCLLAWLSWQPLWVGAAENRFGVRDLVTVEVSAPAPPPDWALWERLLLEQYHPAAIEFVRRYTRPDGTLVWRREWPGMDGSDDGYESFYNFPLYYALGGHPEIHRLSHKLWDAVTGQFTAYGQVHKEFDGYYDWMHHGESYVYFYFFGLSDPTFEKVRARAVRFAGFYLNEDPEARNWDPEHKLIRSPINGSRGPRFVNTAEDWVTHRPVLAGYPLPYDDIPNVTSSSAWVDDQKFPFILAALNQRMMRGDVPLNLTATSLMLNAYMYTGAEKYRTWVLEYVRAWMERTKKNHGIIPDNVGPSGRIGENMAGKWWGGYYGWRWPHGFFNLLESTTIGAANALLLTGDRSFLELPRSQIDVVTSHGRSEAGRFLVPHKYDDRGWYAFGPLKAQYPIDLWYLSRRPDDWARVEKLADVATWNARPYAKQKGDAGNEPGWVSFLHGENPDYPETVLRQTYAESLRRLQAIRSDRTTVDEQDVHHWQNLNPVILEGLVQLMLGGPNHIYHGGLLHCQVRYFDPRAGRPGVPADVAALVRRIDDDGVEVTLVNLHPSAPRDVLLQAGAFGEHQFTDIECGQATVPVNRKFFHVHLGPGTVATLKAGMKRFANRPTYAFPWHGDAVPGPGALR